MASPITTTTSLPAPSGVSGVFDDGTRFDDGATFDDIDGGSVFMGDLTQPRLNRRERSILRMMRGN